MCLSGYRSGHPAEYPIPHPSSSGIFPHGEHMGRSHGEIESFFCFRVDLHELQRPECILAVWARVERRSFCCELHHDVKRENGAEARESMMWLGKHRGQVAEASGHAKSCRACASVSPFGDAFSQPKTTKDAGELLVLSPSPVCPVPATMVAHRRPILACFLDHHHLLLLQRNCKVVEL